MVDGAMACPSEDCGRAIGYEELLEFANLTDKQIARLDERGRPEVEWLREKYRGWMPDVFDLAAGRTEFARHPESDLRNR